MLRFKIQHPYPRIGLIRVMIRHQRPQFPKAMQDDIAMTPKRYKTVMVIVSINRD